MLMVFVDVICANHENVTSTCNGIFQTVFIIIIYTDTESLLDSLMNAGGSK